MKDKEYIIDVDHVTIRFNKSRQGVDNLKEYVIHMLKRELLFQGRLPESEARGSLGADWHQRFRKIYAFEGHQWYYEAI